MGSVTLMRHGALPGKWQSVYLGQTDVGLSEAGKRRVAALAELLMPGDFTHLLSSDLQRCRQTAAIVAPRLALEVILTPKLREIDLGNWEGQSRAWIKQCCLRAYRRRGRNLWHFRCPGGGESFAQVAERACQVVDWCLSQRGQYLLVTHAGVISCLQGRYLGERLDKMLPRHIPYGGMLALQIDPTGG